MKNTILLNDAPALHGGKPVFPERFRFIQPTLPSMSDVLQTYDGAYQRALITNGDLVARFESAAAEWLGVPHCVAVSSCTSGLILVLRALGLAGEVIIPSFTFFATAHAARWNGLQPVFADCDADTWNIDPADVERRITPRTTGIMAVHLYGNPCNVDALERIAKKHNLKLIFDAAHAFGTQYRGVRVGGFGDAEVFSLSPTKLLVAGEGGLVATRDAKLAETLRIMRNYGDRGNYDPDWQGLNARMPEFNAALALAGLPMMEEKLRARNRVAAMYTERLRTLPGTKFQSVDPKDGHTYKDYSVHLTPAEFGMNRDELAGALLAENIETKKYFWPPLHKQRLYRAYYDPAVGGLTNTDYVTSNILSLPIYESLSEATVDGIATAIERISRYQGHTTGQERRHLHATLG
jgi:dTDP-4-amino-4,6-dideoxygalactose transaminase